MVEVMETVSYFFDVSGSSKKEKYPFEKVRLSGLNDHSLPIAVEFAVEVNSFNPRQTKSRICTLFII